MSFDSLKILRLFFPPGAVSLDLTLSKTFLSICIFQDKSSIDLFPIPLAIIGGKYDIYQVSIFNSF